MSDLCNNAVDLALDLQSMDMELLEVEEKLQALTLKEEERDKKLEAMVLCAACSKPPVSLPIFNCPTGHLICSSCYRGPSSWCPVCKTKMGRTVSLLAQALITSLKFSCKNQGCGAKMVVGEVDHHEANCASRMISCPVGRCAIRVQANKLMEHLHGSCQYFVGDHNLEESLVALDRKKKRCQISKRFRLEIQWIKNIQEGVASFTWEGNIFLLTFSSFSSLCSSYFTFNLLLVGSKEECKDWLVRLEVVGDQGTMRSRAVFEGRPKPPNSVKEDRDCGTGKRKHVKKVVDGVLTVQQEAMVGDSRKTNLEVDLTIQRLAIGSKTQDCTSKFSR